ncbi:MAG: CoA transferase [Actinomycetota bacterium]
MPDATSPDALRDRVAAVAASVAELVPGPAPAIDDLRLDGNGTFVSCFDVDTAAFAAAALSNLAAGIPALDRDRVVALFSGKVEVDGEPVPTWADLSGTYRTATGGFIQFHCNFPHHADGVVRRLGCKPTKEAIQRAVLDWDPDELEAQLIADGMIAARMRTLDEWADHPHAGATADLPLITVERIGDAEPRPRHRTGDRPLRVLDCSRVLAGPVTGMTLAANGADVLRVGASRLPSVELCVLATGFGKRNTDLDLAEPADAEAFGRLLDGADVWIDGYRPGALAGLGFPIDRAAPGSVTVQVNAFDGPDDIPTGRSTPWAGRRGYDSIVQTTTGIAAEGMARSGRDGPTPLPVQANDFCTGLLAAFAAEQLVAHQAEVGGTWLARLSLLRTRNWLVGLREPVDFEPAPVEVDPAARQTVATEWGAVTAARPIGGSWDGPPRWLGTSEPVWR